jgi:hypothetical protein
MPRSEIWHQARCVARRERCYERHQKVLELEHYPDVLTKKPGALAGSTELEQCRAQARSPASYDQFWDVLRQRQGKQEGTRAMIDILAAGTGAWAHAGAPGSRTSAGVGRRRGSLYHFALYGIAGYFLHDSQ